MDVTTIARITEKRRARRGVVGFTLIALLGAMLVWTPTANATIASSPKPATWGTNGKVHSLVRDGNVLYVGGEFTAVVSPDGSQTQPRNGLAAIDLTTGQPTPWDPNVGGLTATVFTMVQSGQRLFVGGDFTSIGGQARSRLAAIDTATGDPISTWTAGFDGRIRALAISGNALYVGGSFEHWKATATMRLRLAAVNATTGDLLPWAPDSNDSVRAIEIAPDGRIIVGGLFIEIDGDPQQQYVAALDAAGNLLPWASRPDRAVLSMAQGNGALYSGSGGEPGGYAWAHNLTTGAFLWSIPSDGDVQGIVVADGRVVMGGHFDVIGTQTARRLAAVDPATGVVDPTWIPDVNGALGVSAVEVGGDVLYVGGDFSTVGGLSRRTIASFDVSPDSNSSPIVSVTSPDDGDTFKTSDRIPFKGAATDFEDGNLTSEISWSSNLDGRLGRGGSVSKRLSAGTHRISAKVKDSGGRVASSSFTVEVTNSPPKVVIKSPLGGSTYRTTDGIPFAGTASDFDDGDLTSAITWTSSIDGPLGSGGTKTRSLSAGTHTVTASVTDAAGAMKTATLTVNVTSGNAAPIVTITAPDDGTGASIGTQIAFAGTAHDVEQGNLGADLAWTSSIDGRIGTGPNLSKRLSEGTHTIRAKVTDAAGATGRAAITVTIGNTAPEIVLTSPVDGSSVQAGTPVAFQGIATDAEDGSLTSALTWSSSIDGPLGTGGSFSTTLSVGIHTITVSATDGGGSTATATTNVTVTQANTPPTIAISSPADGEHVRTRDRISFTAAASDVESGDLTSSIAWESNIEGPLGNGGTVTGRLTKGTHTITASATDGGGLVRATTITVVVANTPPQLFVTSPTAGATFPSTDDILFAATADDFDDGDLGSSIEWTSSIEGPFGTGPSYIERLVQGVHTITASVTDSDGATRSASLTITVTNTAPTVTLVAPANGATFRTSNLISFQASAADNEDGNLTSSIAWSSELDGSLGTGGSFTKRLSPGTHIVTAKATDAGGLTRTASVTVDVTNSLPTISIQAPSAGSSFTTTDAITFRGAASDFDDGDLASSISWSSNIDGSIGGGGTVVRQLSSGSHTITARVTDSDGATRIASVPITVGGSPPTVSIEAPENGGSFQSGDDIHFKGAASDFDDGILTGQIAWTSSIDGPIGTGGEFTRRLSPGSHTVTARVTDSDGASRTASVTIAVADTPPTIAIEAPAGNDSFTTSDDISFLGEASDVDDGDLSSSILWTSDRDGVLGTGASLTKKLSRGTHVITASVTDSATTARTASLTLSVGNSPPAVSIQSPADGSTFSTSAQISFRATAGDFDQGDLTGSIVWTSSISGGIGTGGNLTRSLPSGIHVITAHITDADGATVSTSVSVSVGSSAPTVSIQSPSNGAGFTTSQMVSFQGTASDPDDGSLSGAISWTSDRDGALGTGTAVTRRLSKGTHVITAGVTDSDGMTSVATVTIAVANSAPSVSISSPSNGASFLRSDNISFQGSAADFDDGGLTSSIAWSSDRDGSLGTGTDLTRRLSRGMHVITARVTDADGASTTASVTITVANTPPTLTISSPSNGGAFVTSDSVAFQGSASDFEQATRSLKE